MVTAYPANRKVIMYAYTASTNVKPITLLVGQERHIAIFIAIYILAFITTYCIGTKHETQFELRSKLPKLKCVKVCSAFQSTMKIALDTI